MQTSRAGKRRSSAARGFTYVTVLAAVVVLGIVAEAGRATTWRALKADREAELIFRGLAYRNAIRSFHLTHGAFPRSLQDLEKDPRSHAKRHIRKLYAEPMAKDEQGEWRLLVAPGGGIAGVASASSEEPLKKANFPVELEKFTGAQSYAEWIFEYTPPLKPPAPKKS
jgi:type II secretory pathway pseudopilin PulG